MQISMNTFRLRASSSICFFWLHSSSRRMNRREVHLTLPVLGGLQTTCGVVAASFASDAVASNAIWSARSVSVGSPFAPYAPSRVHGRAARKAFDQPDLPDRRTCRRTIRSRGAHAGLIECVSPAAGSLSSGPIRTFISLSPDEPAFGSWILSLKLTSWTKDGPPPRFAEVARFAAGAVAA